MEKSKDKEAKEENEAGRISGDHGGDHSTGGLGGNYQAVLSGVETRASTH